MKVEPVDGVACSVNCLSPKSVWSLVLIKHGPRHGPLHYTILLRCVGRRELMLDALILKEGFDL
jgi:hypothetical protein